MTGEILTGDTRPTKRGRPVAATAAIALAVVAVALAASSVLDGASLDDFWTLYLSDSAIGLEKLARDRWILDIRPPLFDVWATLLNLLGLSSIPLGRLVSHLPALLLLTFSASRFGKRLPEQQNWYTLFVLLMLSAPATVAAFGVYRGDFWQLTAFSIQIMLARHILYSDKDYRVRADGVLWLIAMPATLASIMLDYGGALFGGVVTIATILAAIARGHKRWARSLVIALLLGGAGVVYFISWQGRAWTEHFDLYQNWIEIRITSPMGIIGTMLFGTMLHNPVALAGAYVGRDRWWKIDTVFVAMLVGAIVAALLAILQIDAQRRLVTPANTADIAVLVAAVMASTGVKIIDDRMWRLGMCGVAAFSAVIAVTTLGLGGAWQIGAKKIARVVTECPQTQVYVASGWRLNDGTASRAAAREEPVFALGYRLLGEANGFKPVLIGPGKTVTATPGRCPVLLWIERVPESKPFKPAKLLEATGLKLPAATKFRLTRTNTGLILEATR